MKAQSPPPSLCISFAFESLSRAKSSCWKQEKQKHLITFLPSLNKTDLSLNPNCQHIDSLTWALISLCFLNVVSKRTYGDIHKLLVSLFCWSILLEFLLLLPPSGKASSFHISGYGDPSHVWVYLSSSLFSGYLYKLLYLLDRLDLMDSFSCFFIFFHVLQNKQGSYMYNGNALF